jgi:Ca-activated chloride channel family protein
MNTCPTEPRLTACLLGDLPKAEADAVHAHIESCPACRAAAAELAPLLDTLRAALASDTAAPLTLDPVRMAAILATPPPHRARRRRPRFWLAPVIGLAATGIIVLSASLFFPFFESNPYHIRKGSGSASVACDIVLVPMEAEAADGDTDGISDGPDFLTGTKQPVVDRWIAPPVITDTENQDGWAVNAWIKNGRGGSDGGGDGTYARDHVSGPERVIQTGRGSSWYGDIDHKGGQQVYYRGDGRSDKTDEAKNAELGIAKSERLTRNYDAALERLAKLDPNGDALVKSEARFQFQQAQIKYDLEDYAGAREELPRVREIAPNNHKEAALLERKENLQTGKQLIEATDIRLSGSPSESDLKTSVDGTPVSRVAAVEQVKSPVLHEPAAHRTAIAKRPIISKYSPVTFDFPRLDDSKVSEEKGKDSRSVGQIVQQQVAGGVVSEEEKKESQTTYQANAGNDRELTRKFHNGEKPAAPVIPDPPTPVPAPPPDMNSSIDIFAPATPAPADIFAPATPAPADIFAPAPPEPAALTKAVSTPVKPRMPAVFNPFVASAEQPLSTFAIDVDTASYTRTRQAILAGQLPEPEAVRTEEVVNAFDYGDRAPDLATFRIFVEGSPSPFGHGTSLIRLGIKGRRLGREESRPAVLTFVVDASGSMAQPDRFGLARLALDELIGRLGKDDRIQLVAFNDTARVLADPVAATGRKEILAAFDRIQCTGSTHLESGLRLAYDRAAAAFRPGAENRVILISDGVANLGTGAAADILTHIDAARRQGITLAVFGVGRGTYNDEMLEQLANRGDGTYRFLDSADEVRRAFVDDLAATLYNIASDVKIQVEWLPAAVSRYRQLGYENRALTAEQFRDDTVDAGEVGSGQSVTALYEIERAALAPRAAAEAPLGMVRVRYRPATGGPVAEISRPILAADLAAAFPSARPQFRIAACAAAFAERLRGSPYANRFSFADVANALRPAVMEFTLDARLADLLRLIEAADRLAK